MFGSWQELKGPYRNRFVKTPEDLIQSLKNIRWPSDNHYARVLTMYAYMELKIPQYNRSQDLCVFDILYTKPTPQIIVVKENELATYKELAQTDWDKKRITPENRDKPAISCGLFSVGILDDSDLVLQKDTLYELSPNKTNKISERLLKLFYPKINFVNNAKKVNIKQKKSPFGDFFCYQVFNKPDSVQPNSCVLICVSFNTKKVVSIINLQIVLPQNVKPSTRFPVTTGTVSESCLRLLHIEIARFTVTKYARLCCSNHQVTLCGH